MHQVSDLQMKKKKKKVGLEILEHNISQEIVSESWPNGLSQQDAFVRPRARCWC